MSDFYEFQPDGVSTFGRETLVWCEDLADPTTPTVTELEAGINLTFSARGFSPNDTEAVGQDIRLGSKNVGESLGRVSSSLDDITYVIDPQLVGQTTPNAQTKHYDSLAPGNIGYLVDRRGLDTSTAFTAAQIVDTYKVQLGKRRRVAVDATGDGTAKFEFIQKPAVIQSWQDCKVAAGA